MVRMRSCTDRRCTACNVGYAFVNFIGVEDLLLFAQSRLGKKWNMYSSEKVLQMSYANYQYVFYSSLSGASKTYSWFFFSVQRKRGPGGKVQELVCHGRTRGLAA